MKKVALIVAGGAGTRMQSNIPKQFLLLEGKPILWYTVNTFTSAFTDIELIIVLPKTYINEGKKILANFVSSHTIQFVEGGATRFESVKNGLNNIKEDCIVFVHDAVRCLVTKELIRECYKQSLAHGNAIPAIPATDSIRLITGAENKQINREQIRIVQTPQTFQANQLITAFQQPYQENFTDEASVIEAAGKKIFLVNGAPENIKITRPIDLIIAEELIKSRD